MKVKDVFLRPPSRSLATVVKITDHQPDHVAAELEEFVVTEEVRSHLERVVDAFLGARAGTSEEVCIWISGFFGSGKTHLLKILGYLLSNRTVRLPDGRDIRVAQHFREKYGLPTALLEKQTQVLPVFLDCLDFSREETRARPQEKASLARRIYASLMQALGYSPIDWVAELERTLEKLGKLPALQEWCQQRNRAWAEISKEPILARVLLQEALPAVCAEVCPDKESTAQFLTQDIMNSLPTEPSRLVDRLMEATQRLGPEGRVLLILDEVGLYIRDNVDRATELQAIAQQIVQKGSGRIWLIVTAQESPEAIDKSVLGAGPMIEWLKDRFRIHLLLTPRNVAEVVRQRLLEKNPHGNKELRQLFTSHVGSLSQTISYLPPTLQAHGIPTTITQESFAAYYPLLPFYLGLMLEVFARLRGGTVATFSGRERSALSVVHYFLNEPTPEGELLTELEVGPLVPFDRLFEGAVQERAVKSWEVENIRQTEALGKADYLSASAVAKTVFLLQRLRDFLPCTADVVAALTYPTLGVDPNRHRDLVGECIQKLQDNGYIRRQEDGTYKFLSAVEQDFERQVGSKLVTTSEKLGILKESLEKKALSNLRRLTYKGVRTFDIAVSLDGQEVSKEGPLRLRVYSSLSAKRREDLETESLALKEGFIWELKGGTWEDKLQRVKQIEKALPSEGKAASPEEEEVYRTYQKQAETLRDELQGDVIQALQDGTIWREGEAKPATYYGADYAQALSVLMAKVADDLFPDFHYAAVSVTDDHIGKTLERITGPTRDVLKKLQLIADDGRPRTDGPVADRVLRFIRDKGNVSGKELVAHFDDSTFGWDSHVVRLAVASLLKAGAISIRPPEGGIVVSAQQEGAKRTLTSPPRFERAQLSLQEGLSTEELDKARDLIARLYGTQSSPALDAVAEVVNKESSERARELEKLLHQVSLLNYFSPRLDQLLQHLRDLARTDMAPAQLVRTFLQKGDALETDLPLLSQFQNWVDKATGPHNLQKMHRFLDGVPWQKPEERYQRLKDSVSRERSLEDVLAVWPQAVEDMGHLESAYQQAYIEAHRQRTQYAQQRLDSLRHHAAFEDAALKEKAERALEPLRRYICSWDGKTWDGGWICPLCRAALESLSEASAVIDVAATNVEAELDRLTTKIKEKEETYVPKSYRVRSAKQLDEAIEDLRRVRSELGPKGIKIDVSWLEQG